MMHSVECIAPYPDAYQEPRIKHIYNIEKAQKNSQRFMAKEETKEK